MAAHCRCSNDYLTTHVMGWIVPPKNSHTIKILSPITSELTVFGERVFREVINLNDIIRLGLNDFGHLMRRANSL